MLSFVHRTLVDSAEPAIAVQELINAAYRTGAPDDITSVIADVHDEPTSGGNPPSPQARVGAVIAPVAPTRSTE
ncbi:hypothetical protein [Actinomadura algeriensis]|uniref:Serine/threonine protein phosphatase PrpC n=1 Tax=Actinomadura algeriensis TaxID=1679523 RepID=A0ABR9JYX5_9ACTN|nr:hypothetical protein [Actinomadura algeriensis]MBE1535593.1 serine/threonine protein phosphatase PrpC [Actinomadura algeriensis]